jgi:hypothetical protein
VPGLADSGSAGVAAEKSGLHAGRSLLAKCRDGVTRPPRRPTGSRGPRCSTRSSPVPGFAKGPGSASTIAPRTEALTT